jgi:hypothetical protein
MKQSLNNIAELQGLLTTLEYQEGMKKDLLANSQQHLSFSNGQLIVIDKKKEIIFTPTNHFHSQVQEKLSIPAGYYKRMLQDATSLLDDNVNHWLKNDDKNFLVRTFQDAAGEYKNTARAFLSDRYGFIDNHTVLIEALEAIKNTGLNIEIVNAELSDTRMFLKVVCPDVEIQAKDLLRQYRTSIDRGFGVISGFTLQNSEIGAGSFKISPRGVVLACTNGLISTRDELKNVHLGARMDELGFNKNKDVMNANIRLIKEQMKHAVKIFLSKEYLTKLVNVYSELGEPKIEAPVDKVIEVIGSEYKISEERRANILKYFIEGADTRRIGLASAMTREVQDLDNADLKHDSEVASFEMLNNFKRIEAAAIKLKPSRN